ncbi:MAG: hypothetical protein ABI723_04940 [Bacteroidia bacterium]
MKTSYLIFLNFLIFFKITNGQNISNQKKNIKSHYKKENIIDVRKALQGKWVLSDNNVNELNFSGDTLIEKTELGIAYNLYALRKKIVLDGDTIKLANYETALYYGPQNKELQLVYIIENVTDSVLSLTSPYSNQNALYVRK